MFSLSFFGGGRGGGITNFLVTINCCICEYIAVKQLRASTVYWVFHEIEQTAISPALIQGLELI